MPILTVVNKEHFNEIVRKGLMVAERRQGGREPAYDLEALVLPGEILRQIGVDSREIHDSEMGHLFPVSHSRRFDEFEAGVLEVLGDHQPFTVIAEGSRG